MCGRPRGSSFLARQIGSVRSKRGRALARVARRRHRVAGALMGTPSSSVTATLRCPSVRPIKWVRRCLAGRQTHLRQCHRRSAPPRPAAPERPPICERHCHVWRRRAGTAQVAIHIARRTQQREMPTCCRCQSPRAQSRSGCQTIRSRPTTHHQPLTAARKTSVREDPFFFFQLCCMYVLVAENFAKSRSTLCIALKKSLSVTSLRRARMANMPASVHTLRQSAPVALGVRRARSS